MRKTRLKNSATFNRWHFNVVSFVLEQQLQIPLYLLLTLPSASLASGPAQQGHLAAARDPKLHRSLLEKHGPPQQQPQGRELAHEQKALEPKNVICTF